MILSIDIGLKNLAMCIMSCSKVGDYSTYEIKLWNVYNILEENAQSSLQCDSKLKNGKTCGKKCGYKYFINNECKHSCKTHFPKTLVKDGVIEKKFTIKQKKISDYLLQDIARSVLQRVTEIHQQNKQTMDNVTKVVIELQPKINNKMKMISHLIYGKFVELFLDKPKTTIRFVSASRKLKAYDGPNVQCTLKTAYAKRKFLAIQYTTWFLNTKFSDQCKEWITLFQASPKKDDLSDTFLMAINGLKTIKPTPD